jgi:hypothetical protein
MKWLAFGVAAVWALGCADQQVTLQDARIPGTNDMALVGSLLFVTSTDRSEVKVLDLKAAPLKDFVRAPNPLEPLTIPVVDRALELARDVRYEGGEEVAGPYVYARGEASSEISVIGGTADQLVELKRLVAPSGTVSALTARGAPTGPSNLYVATYDGLKGRVFEVMLPDVTTVRVATVTFRPLLEMDNEFVSSMLTLPTAGQIAVATRSAAGTGGRTFLFDTVGGAITGPTLAFPSPVRKLVTHPAAPNLPEGSRLFGVLDEGSCGALPLLNEACRGIFSVDVATGAATLDHENQPMAPIQLENALISGLTLVPNGQLATSEGTVTVDLLGVVTGTSSHTEATATGTGLSGPIYFFRADWLRMIDMDPTPPSGDITYFTPEGEAVATYLEGPILHDPANNNETSVKLGDGAVRDEIVSIVYEGILPGFQDLYLPGSELNEKRFPAPPEAVARVQVGDRLLVRSANVACVAEVGVTSLEAGALVTTETIPPECLPRRSFSVRASGAQPFVVSGTASGYMGRTANNATFTFAGRYYTHPAGFNPATPQVEFKMGAGDPGVKRDSRYQMRLEDFFLPYSVALQLGDQGSYTVPSSVVYASGLETHSVFVAFPSAAAVVELLPAALSPNVANTRYVVSYR